MSAGAEAWLYTINGGAAQDWQVKPASPSSGTAQPDMTLTQGQSLVSPHETCYLIQQNDGNLVTYAGTPSALGNVLWASVTYDHPNSYLKVTDTKEVRSSMEPASSGRDPRN